MAVFLLVSLQFFLPFSALAQTNGTIAVGSSLTADNNVIPWLSTSGDFAFGFQQIQNNDQFIVSIWYEKIPEKTIVWFTNEATQVQRGSRIELSADRGLVLSDPQGKKLRDFYGSAPNKVSYGVMNNTGNFEILGTGSIRIWSTFQHPSDTLLPTQILERQGVLYSRLTPTNFSRGRFKFIFQEDGNFVLYTQNVLYNSQYGPYFSTGTSDSKDVTNIGYRVIFNETGYMYVLKVNNESILMTPQMERRVEDYYLELLLIRC